MLGPQQPFVVSGLHQRVGSTAPVRLRRDLRGAGLRLPRWGGEIRLRRTQWRFAWRHGRRRRRLDRIRWAWGRWRLQGRFDRHDRGLPRLLDAKTATWRQTSTQ